MLRIVRDNPEVLCQGTSRSSLQRDRQNLYSVLPKHGASLELSLGLIKSDSLSLEDLDIKVMLQHYCKEFPHYAFTLHSVLVERGDCWNLVLYLDEVSPGDGFSPDNRRKVMVIWISCAELSRRLCQEDLWLPLLVVRSQMLKQVFSLSRFGILSGLYRFRYRSRYTRMSQRFAPLHIYIYMCV